MDKRAVKNVQQAKTDQSKLSSLVVNDDELAKLTQEAKDFYYCALSQENVIDILKDAEDRENVIGFGLAVTRPEHAVDDPTSVSKRFRNC